ncbi:transposon protein [Striga asiatica]|uniref:Transposon protein n=1 Tax=Striga asiatica TaxID=4170 RepID=A0A5A7P9C2_STRAF|nr:transposon protein [Striga asiatica]
MEDVQIETDQEANYPPEASPGEKRSREGKMRSKVWHHFTKILKEDGKCDKCQCNHCQKLFTCSSRSGTTHLLRHITDGICPVFRKDPSAATPISGSLLLPWKLERPGPPEIEPTAVGLVRPNHHHSRGDSAWAAEFRGCVARLVELANGKIPAGFVGGGPPAAGSPDHSISAALSCLNEMQDIPQSSEMYLDAFEILQDAGERECFICLPPEPRRRWLQRMLHRRHPLRYSSNMS